MNMDPGYWEINDENSVTIQTQIGEIYTEFYSAGTVIFYPFSVVKSMVCKYISAKGTMETFTHRKAVLDILE